MKKAILFLLLMIMFLPTSCCCKSISNSNTDSEAYRVVGEAHLNTGNFLDASKYFNMSGGLKANNVDDLVKRSHIKFMKNDFKGAFEDLDKALEISPDAPEIYVFRSSLKDLRKDFKGALEDLDKAISLKSDSYAFMQRGKIKVKLKDFKGATEDYNKAVSLDPESSKPLYFRGILKYESGEIEDSLKDLDKAIILNPKDVVSIYYRGKVRHDSGDIKGALKDFDNLITLNENSNGFIFFPMLKEKDVYFSRAKARYDYEYYLGALDDANKALENSYRDEEIQYFKGVINKKMGNYKVALEDFERAKNYFYEEEGKKKCDQIIKEIEKELKAPKNRNNK